MNIEAMKLAQDLRALADRFSEGWHDGIKIDASDIMLLSTAAEAIEQAKQAEPVAINIMREMLEVQGQHGNWNYDSYMHGLYNGMEYMVALAEKREPQFRDAPETWLAKYEVKRDNFNNVVECKAAHGITASVAEDSAKGEA